MYYVQSFWGSDGLILTLKCARICKYVIKLNLWMFMKPMHLKYFFLSIAELSSFNGDMMRMGKRKDTSYMTVISDLVNVVSASYQFI